MSPWDSLLAAAQIGAEWAWERIYRDLAPAVRGYLVAHGAADPDDLLGEVWLQVARNIGTFTGDEAGFRSWVFVVAHHRVIDERRRRSRRPETSIDPLPDDHVHVAPSADEEALAAVGTEQVLRLLAALTDDQRDILTLRILGDLTVEQVAEAVGKSPGAVKALQRRALTALREILEQGVPPGVGVAADASAPGDALYGLDRAMESVGIADGGAAERLAEAEGLMEVDLPAVVKSVREAAEDTEMDESDKTDAIAALEEAAARVLAVENEQSLETREQVAALLATIRAQLESEEGFDGRAVADQARMIRPEVELPDESLPERVPQDEVPSVSVPPGELPPVTPVPTIPDAPPVDAPPVEAPPASVPPVEVPPTVAP